jgi:uncharacterized membrane protein
MNLSSPTIIVIIVIAVIIIIFLAWRNLKDEKDNDPKLTDELEKIKKEQDKTIK